MRVAIVENTKVTHHGQVGVALHERAALIDLYKPWADGVLPQEGSFDALVVFGGEQSAIDDKIHPYLPRLADLMAETAAKDLAVLGVCLGSQLFARGLGATNIIGTAREFGWCGVSLRAEASGDPVLGALADQFSIFQWHSDTFSAPPSAVHLAGSDAAPVQCFRFGRAGYGTQFHFEASQAVVRDWVNTFRSTIDTMAPGWSAGFEAQCHTLGREADANGLQIARAWTALI